MWHSIKVFLFLPPLLFALDYIWLGIFASSLYKKELGGFLRMSGDGMQPIIWAALVVYIAIPAGIVLFALPRVSQETWSVRASSGALSSASWCTRSTT
jgi:uncharacterized membrane protein